jgi:hypothetical protein
MNRPHDTTARRAMITAAIIAAAIATTATAPPRLATAAALAVAPTHKPNAPIVATYRPTIPEDAQLQITWTIDAPAQLVTVPPATVHVWAPPGLYSLSVRGLWTKTRTVTVEGKPAQLLEGMGLLDDRATFTVEATAPPAPQPPPQPPTPPAPAKPAHVSAVIIEETAKRTPAQAAAMLDSGLQDWAKTRGHQLYVFDKDLDPDKTADPGDPDKPGAAAPPKAPDKFKPFFQSARDKPLPRLVIAETGATAVTVDVPCPETAAAIRDVIQQHTAP